jgi:hypothetical protein
VTADDKKTSEDGSIVDTARANMSSEQIEKDDASRRNEQQTEHKSKESRVTGTHTTERG